ncbi:hypothetical protein QQM39_15880 [Streptomyces sp. DT2A-34]|uniref:hypothetical protein n=1 Tax=Streptomyces sp. DT2A-34 TaxID=3051182 RepID=UPI00265C61C3|nr:hypothetical protein [Streptomyces sp. DT2A-34]MDO0912271.1 hypothetical protein [Streptomyces sp. DT2A-34]
MADEQYRWLDRETAERLLRGESLEAVDAANRDQAERLAKTLESLTAEPPLSSAELPGEAAALAAFRAARADRADAPGTTGHSSGSHASDGSDAGLVRIGTPARAARRPRWARPARLGLAAALAVGMVGGVAVAAGTGVLPTPFDRDEPGRPAASVSPSLPERTLVSPSPENGAQGEPTPDGGSKGSTGSGNTQDTAPGSPAPGRETAAPDRDEHSDGWWRKVTSSCRDLRDGKQLSVDRRRALESAAGGSVTVRKYCQSVLTGVGESTGSPRDEGKGDVGQEENADKGKDKDTDKGDDDRRDQDQDQDQDQDRDRDRDRDRDKGRSADADPAVGVPTSESS